MQCAKSKSMYHFLPWVDLPVALLLYSAFCFSIWSQFFKSPPETVENPQPRSTMPRAAFRLALVFLTMLLACYLLNIAFWIVAVILGVLVIGVGGGAYGGAGEFLGLLGMPFVAVGYFIKEFILGFPEMCLDPPTSVGVGAQIDSELSSYLGKEVIAVSTLSPQGNVQFDGQRLEAASASGAMISAGTKLKVIGIQDRQLLVAEQIESENAPVN